ncbi:hypothetical protein AUP68_08489 [Ilyonectria robusta]
MSTTKRIITVTGSTGCQGGSVARALARDGTFHVRAVTRDITSAAAKELAKEPNLELVQADYAKPETLAAAFKGAEAVFGLTNFFDPEVQKDQLLEVKQGALMGDLCKELGVKVFIWSTSPSGLIRSGGQFDSPRLVENKYAVSQYLNYKNIVHVDLYVGTYMENWRRFNQITRAADGKLELFQPVWNPDCKIGLVYLERDLGRIVIAILNNYETKPQLLKEPVYAVGGMWSPDDLAQEIRKQTGEKLRIIHPPTWGNKWLDLTYTYYNEWGVFSDVKLPHSSNATLGLKLHTLAGYVAADIVPHLKTLKARDTSTDEIFNEKLTPHNLDARKA